MEGLVAKRSKISFDPKAFLSKVNGGRAVSDYRKDQIVYRQGEPSDSVFYIQSGKVKQTVLSEHGKEAVVAHICINSIHSTAARSSCCPLSAP